jgi:hypothetical protein
MQFTIEKIQKRSKTSHDHATFHFGRKTGKVWLLSRNVIGNSVSDYYRHIGQCDANDPKVVHIWSNDPNASLVASWLAQKGFKPHGPTFNSDTQLTSWNPKRDGYDFRFTDPQTIRNALGLPSQMRRKSLDLGVAGKADKVARSLSIEDMRAGIVARNAKETKVCEFCDATDTKSPMCNEAFKRAMQRHDAQMAR